MPLLDYYPVLRLVHIGTVIASGSLFLLRGFLAQLDVARVRKGALRFLPHLIDTCLLVSAILLAVATRQSPIAEPWLGAKIIALVIYIGLGVVVMRNRPMGIVRMIAYILALLVFSYIVLTAITRSPIPF